MTPRKNPTPCPGCGLLPPHKECIYRTPVEGLVAAYISAVLPRIAKLEELNQLPEGPKGTRNQLLRRIPLELTSSADLQTIFDHHTTLIRRLEAVESFRCDFAKSMKPPLPPAARK